jgi:hypothetical protein
LLSTTSTSTVHQGGGIKRTRNNKKAKTFHSDEDCEDNEEGNYVYYDNQPSSSWFPQHPSSAGNLSSVTNSSSRGLMSTSALLLQQTQECELEFKQRQMLQEVEIKKLELEMKTAEYKAKVQHEIEMRELKALADAAEVEIERKRLVLLQEKEKAETLRLQDQRAHEVLLQQRQTEIDAIALQTLNKKKDFELQQIIDLHSLNELLTLKEANVLQTKFKLEKIEEMGMKERSELQVINQSRLLMMDKSNQETIEAFTTVQLNSTKDLLYKDFMDRKEHNRNRERRQDAIADENRLEARLASSKQLDHLRALEQQHSSINRGNNNNNNNNLLWSSSFFDKYWQGKFPSRFDDNNNENNNHQNGVIINDSENDLATFKKIY